MFNNTGTAITINVSGGDSPSIRNSAGSTTTVVNTVTVTVKVTRPPQGAETEDQPVEGASVYVQDSAGPFNDNQQIMREFTNASGIATESYAYSTDTPVIIDVRAAGFRNFEGSGTIENTGLSATIRLSVDPDAE